MSSLLGHNSWIYIGLLNFNLFPRRKNNKKYLFSVVKHSVLRVIWHFLISFSWNTCSLEQNDLRNALYDHTFCSADSFETCFSSSKYSIVYDANELTRMELREDYEWAFVTLIFMQYSPFIEQAVGNLVCLERKSCYYVLVNSWYFQKLIYIYSSQILRKLKLVVHHLT